MPSERYQHSAVWIGDQLLVFGGRDGNGYSIRNDLLWSFDLKANQWIEIKPEGPMPSKRHCHSALCIGDQMLVFGGHGWREDLESDGSNNDLWSYALKAGQPHAGYQAAELQTPSVAPRTFASSSFKELYEECQAFEDDSIFVFAHHFISWLKQLGVADVAKKIEQKLLAKVREGFTVSKLATFAWTLTEQVHGRPLCSYMNEIVREDEKERLLPLMPLVRAMNSFLVTRGKEPSEWPPENVTYRGAGIPNQHMDFFQKGLQYRSPMFLATSFDQDVAMDFARMHRKGKNMVIFHVHFDTDLRCNHVNYLKEATDVESEAEFLFPPYSAFTVKSPPEKEGNKWVIHIEAFPDNCEAPEDLPLALWH
eukprot:Skav214118  [mRNA]  locus=scaffold1185:476168:477265:- [translate_table: standard]